LILHCHEAACECAGQFVLGEEVPIVGSVLTCVRHIRSVALNSGEYGSSSLGTLKEFSDRITTIKQLTGDEAQEIFLKFQALQGLL